MGRSGRRRGSGGGGLRRKAEAGQVEALFELGTQLAEVGDPEGLALLRRALAAAPGERAIRNNLAHALREAGELDEALALFQEGVDASPGDAVARYGLATVLVKQGRLAAAEQALARAVAADGAFAEAVAQHGDVLEALGRPTEAMEAFTRALALRPRDARLLRKLGLMHAFLGRKPVAVAMLRQTLALRPDDPLAQHMLDALTGTERAKADGAYVRELFDAFADSFDTHLQDVLGYRVPARVAELLGSGPLGRVLDLGCGTGLLAPQLAGRTESLVGVDLSEGMLEKARRRGGYDALHAEGIEAFLASTDRRFDVVVAADVFVYVGDLEAVFAGVRACCDGRFVFTTELAPSGLELRPSGRYAHGRDLVEDLARRYGFGVVQRVEEPLRNEGTSPVMGQLVVLASAG